MEMDSPIPTPLQVAQEDDDFQFLLAKCCGIPGAIMHCGQELSAYLWRNKIYAEQVGILHNGDSPKKS